MSNNHIFISHASADDPFVAELRTTLERLGHTTWVDSRELRGGDGLNATIERAIADARAFVVALTPSTFNSVWVRNEIRHALDVREQRGGDSDDYRVVPLLLPGVEPSALGLFFPDDEPLAIRVDPAGRRAERGAPANPRRAGRGAARGF